MFLISSLCVIGVEIEEDLGEEIQGIEGVPPALALPRDDMPPDDMDEAVIGPTDPIEPVGTSEGPSEANYEKPKEEEPVITPIEPPKDDEVLTQPDLPREDYIEPDKTGALPEFNTFGLLAAGLLGAGAWLFVRKR